MSIKYKFIDNEGIYFVSFATVSWVDVFTRPLYHEIFVDSVRYCQKNKGLNLHAWCLMSNHVHLVFSRSGQYSHSDILRDLSNTNLGVHNMGYVKGHVISDGLVAELTWEYDTKFANSLSDFSIYQKVDLAVTNTNPNLTSPVDPNPYILIRTIDHVQAKRIAMANGKTGYMVHVEGLNPEKYITLIPLVPDPKPGNNSSPLPGAVPNVSSPFMYKIVANHRDGGWSEPVITPLIKTQ